MLVVPRRPVGPRAQKRLRRRRGAVAPRMATLPNAQPIRHPTSRWTLGRPRALQVVPPPPRRCPRCRRRTAHFRRSSPLRLTIKSRSRQQRRPRPALARPRDPCATWQANCSLAYRARPSRSRAISRTWLAPFVVRIAAVRHARAGDVAYLHLGPWPSP